MGALDHWQDFARRDCSVCSTFSPQSTSANVYHSTNTTVKSSPNRADASSINIPHGENKLPAPIDPSIDKWFFISGAPQ
jgi:hypothetical protein